MFFIHQVYLTFSLFLQGNIDCCALFIYNT
nr:MAG TPA: hypothetical protein [Caudoviricetes sp.]